MVDSIATKTAVSMNRAFLTQQFLTAVSFTIFYENIFEHERMGRTDESGQTYLPRYHLCLSAGRIPASICSRLVQLQLVHGAEYAEQGKSISSASTRVEAARGEILDRNGNPLVTNRQGNSITFTAEKFPADNKDEIAQRNQLVNSLIELLESKGEKWIDNLPLIYDESGKIAFPENRESDVAYLKSDEILHVNSYATAQNCLDALIEKYSLQEYTPEQARKIASVYYEMHRLMFSKRTPYTFAEDVSTQTVAEIKEKSDFYQGVEIEVVPYREYVDGALAPHILGMVGAISENEYEKYKEKGYLQTDSIAKTASKRQWKNTCAAQTA
mgnify:CR=1 FL=1